jgi:hypothetical protein
MLRLAGFAVLAGFILFSLFQISRDFNARLERVIRLGLMVLTSLALFLVFNQLIFPIGTGGLFSFYLNSFRNTELFITQNLENYFEVARNIFPVIGLWFPAFWIVISLLGWLLKFIQSPTLPEFVFPVYILVILLYPYSDAGTRFLIPILPLLIYYLGYFLKFLFSNYGNAGNKVIAGVYVLLLVSYGSYILFTFSNRLKTEDGPQMQSATEMFYFAKTLQGNTLFVFCRARAFSLYTGKNVLYPLRNQSADEKFRLFQKYKNLYLVIPKTRRGTGLSDPGLHEVVRKFNNNYRNIFSNDGFEIYEQYNL